MNKLAILGGALCLVAVAGCAGITDKTGITAEQQVCVANTLVAIEADAAVKDARPQQKAALVAQACGISLDAIVLKAAAE